VTHTDKVGQSPSAANIHVMSSNDWLNDLVDVPDFPMHPWMRPQWRNIRSPDVRTSGEVQLGLKAQIFFLLIYLLAFDIFVRVARASIGMINYWWSRIRLFALNFTDLHQWRREHWGHLVKWLPRKI
jgi:hypothetical protein